MKVIAKFQVDEKVQTRDGFQIKLFPVTGGSPENEQFYKWTPAGNILLSTINETAAEAFVVGKSYYVSFALAE